jgi:anthranilate 1,2-dioxygenase large subunit
MAKKSTPAKKGAAPANGGTRYKWPDQGFTAIPDWVYTSEEIYARELELIFEGPTWNFVGLEAEIPNSGDFRRTHVGTRPVIIVRDAEGAVRVVENRCAHRGAQLCRPMGGNTNEFTCPYHQWMYDLSGNLIGVPFRRGLDGEGGVPDDFRNEDHGLRKLQVATRNGVVFASYSDAVEPLVDYLGAEMIEVFDQTFDGRELKILGYYRNTIPSNWKSYHENLKDPYHATLLHAYLVTFGLFRAGQKLAMIVDETGRHGALAATRGDEPEIDAETKKLKAFREDMVLQDGRIMDFVDEFKGSWTVTMQTIWPNFIVQRELNTLGTRQIVPKGPHAFDLHWTMFGFADDDDEMTRHRLRQGNLMGPAGFLGAEDGEALGFVQEGVRHSLPSQAFIGLGGTEEGASTTPISESALRSMYRYYSEVMGL